MLRASKIKGSNTHVQIPLPCKLVLIEFISKPDSTSDWFSIFLFIKKNTAPIITDTPATFNPIKFEKDIIPIIIIAIRDIFFIFFITSLHFICFNKHNFITNNFV